MKTIYITAICAVMAVGTEAQDLSKEITIEKDIVPEQLDVTRLSVTPVVSLPAVSKSKLSFIERNRATEIPAQISTLEPVAYADSLSVSPYRGYAGLGYFPTYNTALSAGYRFINSETVSLNGWLQYNGKIYDGKSLGGDEMTLRSHTASIGVDFAQKIESSQLAIAADYTLSRYNVPLYSDYYYQTVNRVNIGAGWTSKVGEFDYRLRLGYGHFGYGQDGYWVDTHNMSVKPEASAPVRENRINIGGEAGVSVADNACAGLDLDITILDYNRNNEAVPNDVQGGYDLLEATAPDYGIATLTPYYLYKTQSIAARVGAKIEFAFNAGKVLHIAPDVRIDWTPTSLFAAYVEFGGGEHVNTLGSIYDITPYAAPIFAYSKSSVPFTLDAGIVIGQWAGAYCTLFGGYAKANDWLMPNYSKSTGFFSPVDIDGWHAGVSVGYNYRDVVDFSVRYETAPQDYDEGYYLWRDRAKHVLNASLRVTPVKQLDVEVAYELRTKRCIVDRYFVEYADMSAPFAYYSHYDLDDVDNLSVNALYRFTPALSAFVRLENIFDKEWFTPGCIQAQGITGLFGLTYKF